MAAVGLLGWLVPWAWPGRGLAGADRLRAAARPGRAAVSRRLARGCWPARGARPFAAMRGRRRGARSRSRRATRRAARAGCRRARPRDRSGRSASRSPSTALRSIGRDDRDGGAAQAGAAGAADAVDVIVGMVRHVEIEDVADGRDVEAARGDVGGDQQRQPRRCGTTRARRCAPTGPCRRAAPPALNLWLQQRAVQQRDLALAVAEDDGVLEVRRAERISWRSVSRLSCRLAAGGDQQLRDGGRRWSRAWRLRRAPDCAGRCRRCAGFPAAWSR